MNPDIILHQIPTMGPIYWVAAAAVALGATLLVVAITMQLRRLKIRFPRPGKAPRLGSILARGKNTGEPEPVKETETGYSAASFAGPAVSRTDHPAGPEILALTARLGRVAETLEDMRRTLQAESAPDGFSALKADDFGVEYLYKTTSG